MGRRSVHTPEELRQLILDAARSVVERDGLVGLSAREIARLIGYSAGTLYNIFENLDDVLLTLQVQMLGELVERLKAEPHDANPHKRVEALARCYVSFALENRRLWNLLFAHPLPAGVAVPPAFHDYVNSVAAVIADALLPLMPAASAADADTASRTLWAGVHGITAIAVTEKAPTMTSATAQAYVAALTKTFIKGLKAT